MEDDDKEDIINVVTLGIITAMVAMMAGVSSDVGKMLLAGAVCLIGVGVGTLYWTKVEYKKQLPDWKKYCKK